MELGLATTEGCSSHGGLKGGAVSGVTQRLQQFSAYLPKVPREIPPPCPGRAGARHRLSAASLAKQQLLISQFTVPTAQR